MPVEISEAGDILVVSDKSLPVMISGVSADSFSRLGTAPVTSSVHVLIPPASRYMDLSILAYLKDFSERATLCKRERSALLTLPMTSLLVQ